MRSECRVSTLRENSRFQLCTQPCRQGGRVWHCLRSLSLLLPQRYDASFLDDYRPPSPLSPAHPLTRVDAHSRGEANHRARLGLAIIFTPDPGNFRRNNTGGIGIRVGHGGYRGRKPV